MPLFTPFYSDTSLVFDTTTLQGLSANGVRKSVPVDNSAIKAVDVRLMLDIQLGSTISAGDSIDLYLAAAHDLDVMTDGYVPNALETTAVGVPVYSEPIISIPAPGGSGYIRWEASLLSYVSSLPRYFSIVFHNKTSSAMNSSHQQRLTWIFTTYEYA
jgi:hypothetical protein